MNAYKFAHHANVKDTPPDNEVTRLFDKAFGDEPLTEEEADTITMRLYGVMGAGGSDYKLAGWCWPMYQAKQMKRILVAFKYERGTFRTYYAPNKKALRKALKSCGSGIAEMIVVPRKKQVAR